MNPNAVAVRRMLAAAAGCLAWWLLYPAVVLAHCDTLDGPVVADAKAALEKGDVAGGLKWVAKEQEAEVRSAFQKTLVVRAKGPEARELADMYFFETLVRLHRASEGEPYTGLKPAGTDPGPAVAAADKALESGSPDALVKLLTDAVAAGVRQRFAQAAEKGKHADESVEAGRTFVEAYVVFVHYAEALHAAATGQSHQPGGTPSAEAHAGHATATPQGAHAEAPQPAVEQHHP